MTITAAHLQVPRLRSTVRQCQSQSSVSADTVSPAAADIYNKTFHHQRPCNRPS